MGNRIVGAVLLVLLCVGVYELYVHYKTQKAEESGAVHCVGCMSPEETARFKIENSGEGVDGQSEHKREGAQQTAARLAAGDASAATPAAVGATPAAGTAIRDTAGAIAAVSGATQPVAPAQTQSSVPAPIAASASPTVSSSLPASDTQGPNAPNGLRFGGSGNYQWYRQGNLTYRVDTTSGRSCVAYATLEEWRKPIVISHGCGRDV